MPDDPETPESPKKLYYSISEVSELLGIKPHVLRYWESQFGSLRPKKNRAGNRMYRERDVGTLRQIQELLHVRRYTIAGARRELPKLRHALKPSAALPASGAVAPDESAGVTRSRAVTAVGPSSESSTPSPAAPTSGPASQATAAPAPPRPAESPEPSRKAQTQGDPSQIALAVPGQSLPAQRIADLRKEVLELKKWLESRPRGPVKSSGESGGGQGAPGFG